MSPRRVPRMELSEQSYAAGWLDSLTPDYVLTMIRNASMSSLIQGQLFDTMISRDATVGPAVERRTRAVADADWTIDVDPNVGGDEGLASAISQVLPIDTFLSAVEHCALYSIYGYACIQPVWDGTLFDIEIVPFGAFEYRMGVPFINLKSGGWKEVNEKLAERFVIIATRSTDPPSTAVLRRCVGPWLIKSWTLRDWARFSERWAAPMRTASYKSGLEIKDDSGNSTDNPEALLAEKLALLGAHGTMVHPAEVEVKILETAKVDASNAFDALIDRCDRYIARVILSQETTLMPAKDGARSSDEVRERQLAEVLRSDSRVVASILTRKLLPVLSKAVSGKPPVGLRFRSRFVNNLPMRERGKQIVEFSNAGAPVDWQAVMKEFGLPALTQAQLDARNPAIASPVVPPDPNATKAKQDRGPGSKGSADQTHGA